MKTLFLAFTAFFLLISFPSLVSAAEPTCMPVYGGGITDKQVCTTPAPSTTKTVPLPQVTTQQTKGGLPIYPAQKSKSTPNTGPESWTIIALAPLALLGFILRNKAKA